MTDEQPLSTRDLRLGFGVIAVLFLACFSFIPTASAAPSVAASTSGNSGANTTASVITMPTGVTSGDLLIVMFNKDGSAAPTSITGTGWNDFGGSAAGTGNYTIAYWKIADGSDTLTVNHASEGTAFVSYRITGHDSSATPAIGTYAVGTNANPDPPSLSPSWGSKDTLWIAFYGWDGNVAHSAYPTNYASNQQTSRWAHSNGSGIAAATYAVTAATEDPGTGTIGANDDWVAQTIAVKPLNPALTISGTLYSDEGVTQITAGRTIKVAIGTSTVTTFSTSTNSGSGNWNITIPAGHSIAPGTRIVAFVDGASEKATTFTKASSSENNITGINLYQNYAIISHEGTSGTSTTNTDLGFYDADDDADVLYTSNGGNLSVTSATKLFIAPSKTFAPGGAVTINGNAGSGNDGSFHIGTNAIYTAGATTTIAGNFTASTSATFTQGSHALIFNATTTGKTINTPFTNYGNLTFNGSGGAWSFAQANATTSDLTITAGTLTAPSGSLSITGNYTNNSTFTAGSGTTTFSGTSAQTATGTMTGTSAFNNLLFTGAGTKTFGANASTSNFTVASGATVVAPSQLSLSGNYLNSGTFTAGSGTTTFSGTSAQSATGTMTGTSAFNNLLFTGAGTKTFGANASTSNFTVASGATVVAPNVLSIVDGNYSNSGTFTAGSGVVDFSGTSTASGVMTGTSAFNTISISQGIGAGGDVLSTSSFAGTATNTNTGYNLPWLTPEFATGQYDFSFSGISVNNQNSDYLTLTNYNFSIPESDSIVGIQVDALLEGDAYFGIPVLVKANELGNGPTNPPPNNFPAPEEIIIFGSSTDLWGDIWRPADINDSGFGFAIGAYSVLSILYGNVDAVKITVYYQEGVFTPSHLTFLDNASTSNFTITASSTVVAPSLLSVSGNYTNNGTFTAGTGTTTLSGTSAQTATGTLSGTSAFYNLRVTNNTATTTFGAPVAVTNHLALNTPSTTVALLASATSTVANLTITGTAGNEVKLRSTVDGTKAGLMVTGSSSVSYANIKDSSASSTSGLITVTSGIDGGNTNGWSFGGAEGVTTLTTGSDPVSTTTAPGSGAVMANAFTFRTDSGTDVISAIVINLPYASSTSLVEITSDNGSTVYGSVANPAGTTGTTSITLSTNTLTATTATTTYKIRITPKTHANLPSGILGRLYPIQASVASWTGTNATAGSDISTTTITIDNQALPSFGLATSSFAAKVDYTTGSLPYSVTAADFNNDGHIDLVVANLNDASVSVLLNNGNGTYADKVDYTTGTWPTSVTAADLDGDGDIDLAVANYNSNSVSVLLNNGDGTYATKVDYTTGTNPQSVTAADLNNDGHIDLAVANNGANSVSILLNNGNGTYATKVDYTTGTTPWSVTAADFDNDGDVDLAVANNGSASVSILLNNGNGTYATKVDYTTGSFPRSVTAADFNNDGHIDLVVANEGANSVSVFLNNGNGTYAARVNYTTGSAPRSVTAADFNNDGRTDLATANNGSASVSVFLNNSTSTLTATAGNAQATISYTTPPQADIAEIVILRATSTAVSNVPVDGTTYTAGQVIGSATVACVDTTVATSTADSCIATGLTNGTTYFFKAFVKDDYGNYSWGASTTPASVTPILITTTLTTGTDPVSTTTAPGSGAVMANAFTFRTDSGTDVISAIVINLPYASSTSLVEITNDAGSTVYGSVANPAGTSGTTSITLSTNTLTATTATTTYKIRITPKSHANLPSGILGRLYPIQASVASWTGTNATSGSDISTTTITIDNQALPTFGLATSSFATRVNYTTGTAPRSVTAADFNNDGHIDLAVANYGPNSVSVFLNNGNGTYAAKVDYTTGSGPISVTAADFDNDGDIDLAVANLNGTSVSVFLNNGNGTYATKVDYTTGSSPHSVTAADFDHDGYIDLAVANNGSNSVSVLRNNGNGTYAAKVDYTTGTNPRSVTAADIDNDGDIDLILANYGSNSVSVLRNNGNGTYAAKVDYTTGSNPASVTAADFDNDGDIDLAVANDFGDSVSVLRNNGNGTYAAKVDYTTGTAPFSVTAADFNNDGHIDLAVANYFSNSVSVFRNNGNGTYAAKVDYTTGAYPYSVTAADFDNDGDIDLAVANNNATSMSVFLNNSPATLTATAGNGQATISYTTPPQSDIAEIVILRATSTPVTNVPVDGTTYTAGQVIGSATVACVDTTVATSTADSCIATGLTNGTTYFFQAFVKDDYGNYSWGASTTPTSVVAVGDSASTLTLDQSYTFYSGQATTTLGTITLQDAETPTITTANDIRLTIATTTTNFRFNTSIITPTFGGTASGKVSGTVSYEDSGATLLINVTENFSASNTLTIAGIQVGSFGAVSTTTSQLALQIDGNSTGTPAASSTQTFRITGTLTSADHNAGQANNQFGFQNRTEATFFAFKLTPTGENATITDTVITLSGIQGTTTNKLHTFKLYRDNNSDLTLDGGDTLLDSNGIMTINGQHGAITFSADFLATTTANYILIANTTNIERGDAVVFSLPTSGIVAIGQTSLYQPQITGTISSIQHERHGAGGGSGRIGGNAPSGAGVVTGGAAGGGGGVGQEEDGENIAPDPDYYRPAGTGTPHNEWTNPTNAYNSDGTYATASSTHRQSYTNFNFNIPLTNTIQGISVKLDASGTTANGTIDVSLSWNNGSSYTTGKATPTLIGSDVVYTVGGATDTWGRAWSASEFAPENFLLRITAAPSGNTLRLDALEIRVHHQATGGGGGGGGRI